MRSNQRLPTAFCFLPTAYSLLPTAYCLLRLSLLVLVCLPLPSTHASGAWTPQRSGTLAWLHDVHFHDQNRGWAIGGGGVLLATEDGGKNWQMRRRPTPDALRDINFIDAQTGWLVCERSVYLLKAKDEPRAYLMRTTDAGATWTRVDIKDSDVDIRLVRIMFANNELGWVFGETGALFMTRDGGTSWTRQRTPTRRLLLDGALIGDRQGWLVGTGATVLRTTDAGETWFADALVDTMNTRLNGVAFVDERRGWAVGAAGRVSATTDGGRTWRAQVSNVQADLYDVKFINETEGWAVGAEGTVIHTTDGGIRWNTESSGTSHSLERLWIVDRTHGWA
ncbi:MAG: hypothetical protein H0T92_20005, partial [Pyrinomonadaceae bacterium]|nr:hypothetical protein [Pyrinomonadaceae bacterium]